MCMTGDDGRRQNRRFWLPTRREASGDVDEIKDLVRTPEIFDFWGCCIPFLLTRCARSLRKGA